MGHIKMTTDFSDYEHKPGATRTLVSDPNTGQPVEVDVDEFGAAKIPELKPTYRPTQAEIDAAKKKPAPPTNPVTPRAPVPPTNPVTPNPTPFTPQRPLEPTP